MNTASRELCQELYELSGWLTDKYYWSTGSTKDYPVKEYRVDKVLDYKPLWFDNPRENTGHVFPAYDLGYLLRKLPKLIALPDNGTGGFLFIDIKKYKSGIRWRAGYHDQMLVNADTPEDAVCSLAIELFKRGILTK
jgi:hypothetical protein